MAKLKTGAAAVRLGVLAAVLLGGAGLWHWHERRAEQQADSAMAPETPHPAPVITPDTVNPMRSRQIYPPVAEARGDIAAALKQAKAEGKRVILDFGGDWCPDCQVLDIYFHRSPDAELLTQNFVKVNINIGQMDQNLDIAARYGIPIAKGVPALAVLDADGKLLYAQKAGEFEAMSRMQSSSVTDFLNQWKSRRA